MVKGKAVVATIIGMIMNTLSLILMVMLMSIITIMVIDDNIYNSNDT